MENEEQNIFEEGDAFLEALENSENVEEINIEGGAE